MATLKPRVPVAFTPEQYEVLKEFSERSGQSMSAVIGELFELVEPTFRRINELARLSEQAGEEAKAGIRAAAEQAELELAPHAHAATRLVEQFDQVVRTAVGADGGGASGDRADRSDPRAVTRGSGMTEEGGRGSRKRAKNK